MPQPLPHKPGDRTTGDHESLAKRPECALLIAQVAAAWAWLENALGQMFRLTTAKISVENDVTKFAPNPIALASFTALESLSARLSVIETSLELVLPKVVPDFTILARSIRRCAKGRNTVVHSCWGINARFPDDMIRMPVFGPQERWTITDFKNVLERIDRQSAEIMQFLTRCSILAREELQKEPANSKPAPRASKSAPPTQARTKRKHPHRS